MRYVYHQVAQATANDILRQGLLQGSGGERRNKDIKKADSFLNALRTPSLLQGSLDRDRNVYCYLSTDKGIKDITSGRTKKAAEIVDDASQTLLRIEVDPGRCFVSDLDLYDHIVRLLQENNTDQARLYGQKYWATLQLLAKYDGSISRPEVLVTYDVPPDAIRRVL